MTIRRQELNGGPWTHLTLIDERSGEPIAIDFNGGFKDGENTGILTITLKDFNAPTK